MLHRVKIAKLWLVLFPAVNSWENQANWPSNWTLYADKACLNLLICIRFRLLYCFCPRLHRSN
jgi:hypothetical protein